MKKQLCFFLLIIFSNVSFISAQEGQKAFETFSFGFNAVKDVHKKSFQQSWEPQLGFEGYLSTSLFSGNLQGGVMYSEFDSSVIDYPDFKLYLFYFQWDYELELSNGILFAVGGRAGLSEMRFAENNIVKDKKLLNESEFGAGLTARLSLAFTKEIHINFNANYLTIFTYPQMNSLFLGAGISKAFSTPDWLKDFLK